MMAERFVKKKAIKFIEIKKKNIPYEFTLDNRFYFEIRHNTYEDRFRFILYDRSFDENDGKGKILGDGEEKAVIDFPLFFPFNSDKWKNRNLEFPLYDIIPRSLKNNDVDINFENLGDKFVFEVVGEI